MESTANKDSQAVGAYRKNHSEISNETKNLGKKAKIEYGELNIKTLLHKSTFNFL